MEAGASLLFCLFPPAVPSSVAERLDRSEPGCFSLLTSVLNGDGDRDDAALVEADSELTLKQLSSPLPLLFLRGGPSSNNTAEPKPLLLLLLTLLLQVLQLLLLSPSYACLNSRFFSSDFDGSLRGAPLPPSSLLQRLELLEKVNFFLTTLHSMIAAT